MSFVTVKNEQSDVLLGRVAIAETMLTRMMGLMGKENLGETDGLWIHPCNSIHTFFMRMSIDAVFLNKDNTVVAIYPALKPWRMTRLLWRATSVIEASANSIASKLKVGDKLRIVQCTN